MYFIGVLVCAKGDKMRLEKLLNEEKFPTDIDKPGSRKFQKHQMGVSGVESAIDGKSKQSAKNMLYKAIKKHHINRIYKDEYWEGPKNIWKTFDQLNLNWQIDSSRYVKGDSKMGTNPMVDVAKEWRFTIWFDNNKGKQQKLYGQLIASGAGSVEDPLEKYDIIVVIS